MARIAVMPHEIGGVSMMEYPSQRLREHIRRIHDSRKVDQDDVLHKSPVLKSKISNLDVTRAIRWSTVIDDLDGRIIVFINGSRLGLSVS